MKKILLCLFFAPSALLAQLKVGDHYAGGIIFFIDSTGNHGEVLAESSIGSFTKKTFKPSIADTIHLLGFSDWIVPSGQQMALVYKNIKKDRNRVTVCGGGTFWTSSIAWVGLYDKDEKTYALFSLTNGIGEDPRTDIDIPYPVRPIRKF